MMKKILCAITAAVVLLGTTAAYAVTNDPQSVSDMQEVQDVQPDTDTDLLTGDIPQALASIPDQSFMLKYDVISNSLRTVEVSCHPDYREQLLKAKIPETVTLANGVEYTVTSIQASGFEDSNVFYLELPNSITSIGASAFNKCGNLYGINIPEDVTYIGKAAFQKCTDLRTVDLPKGITDIGDKAFGNCTSLTRITVEPGGNGKYFSDENGALFEVKYEEKPVEKLITRLLQYPLGRKSEKYELRSNSNIVGDFIIGVGAFEGSTYIESVYIGPNVNLKEMEEDAFKSCKKLTSIDLKDTAIEAVGVSAFEECENLSSVELPETVIRLYTRAFFGCKALKLFKIPDEVTQIGNNVFSECSGLTSITIPKKVVSMGELVFIGCTSLKEINVEDGNSNFRSDNGVLYNTNKWSLECYPAGRPNYAYTILESTLIISKQAFSGCQYLQTVNIPKSIGTIGNSTFKDCISLESVVISNGITDIEDDAFNGCVSLLTIRIPESIKKIGERAFKDCTKLDGISFFEGVQTIKQSTFSGCSSLRTVVLPKSVTTISSNAFEDCSNLKTLNLPENISTIESFAFCNSGLTSIEIPNNIRKLEDSVFEGCMFLNSVLLPDMLREIGNRTFYNCERLLQIKFPDNVTTVGDDAFSGCKRLTSLTIPSNLITIHSSAFNECTGLETLIIHDGGRKTIEKGAFAECTALTNIHFRGSNNISKIDEGVFANDYDITDVYFRNDGTREQWNRVNIGDNNGSLSNPDYVYDVHCDDDEDANKIDVNIPKVSSDLTVERTPINRIDWIPVEIDENGILDVSEVNDGEYIFKFSSKYCAPREYLVKIKNGVIREGLEGGVELRLYGDLNKDGKVTIFDVYLADEYVINDENLRGFDDYDFLVFDIDKDTYYDAADILRIYAHVQRVLLLYPIDGEDNI